DLEGDPIGGGGLDGGQEVPHSVHHRQGAGVGVLEDDDVARPLAVDVDDVLLHRVSVTDVRHVTEQHRGPVHHLDRDGVELVDGRRAGVELDVVLGGPDLGSAGGDDDVRLEQRLHHVVGGEALRRGRCGVHVHHDLPLLAAVGAGDGGAGNREEADPEEV